MKRIRKALKLVGIWCLILVGAGLVAEVILRIIPQKEGSNVKYTVIDEFGIWREPDQTVYFKSKCYKAKDIPINSYGMRGGKIGKKSKRRIGFFGDSMLEGLQVEEGDHFVNKLNALFAELEILNFGIRSTGTTAQLENLKFHQPKLDLDAVYLFFYPANDIRNNSMKLEKKMNGGNRGYLPHFVQENGEFTLDKNYSKQQKLQWLKRSRVINLLNDLRHDIRKKRAKKSTGYPWVYDVFRRNMGEDWQEAHMFTIHSLLELKNYCDSEEIELTVVILPSINELLTREEIAEHHEGYAELMEFSLPHQHYRKQLNKLGIRYLDFTSYMKIQSRKIRMSYPYIAFECDGHYDQTGHAMLADYLASDSMFSL